MGKQIKIRIYPDGKIESQKDKIKGKSCLKYIQPLESLLEAKIVDSEFTHEYYEVNNLIEETEVIKINN